MEINLPTILLQIAGLLLLVFIMKKLLYKPMLNFLDKRVETTKKLIEETEKNKKNSEKTLHETMQELEKAKKEALNIKEMARNSGLTEKEKIIKKSCEESEQIVFAAKEEIKGEIDKAKQSLKNHVGTLSTTIAEKILRREMSKTDRERYIKLFSKELETKKNE